MGKSNWRLKFINKSTMSRVIKESLGVKIKKNFSMITNKASVIPKSFIDNTFFIHKGCRYRELKIGQFHVGFKFGEFILTRKPHVYRKKSK